MTITFGRRQLIVALMGAPLVSKRWEIPFAVNASDAELARINERLADAETRRHWETSALMYGGPRPR